MEGIAKVEAEPKLDGRNMIMVLAPDKRARQAAQARAANQQRDREGRRAGDRRSRAAAAEAQTGTLPARPVVRMQSATSRGVSRRGMTQCRR